MVSLEHLLQSKPAERGADNVAVTYDAIGKVLREREQGVPTRASLNSVEAHHPLL